MSDVPVVSDSLPTKFYSAVSDLAAIRNLSLPDGIALSYGCSNCDWKDSGLCPYGFKPLSHDHVPDFICKERAAYLKGFYRGEKPDPTFTEWEADYSQGVALKLLQHELSRIRKIDDQLADLRKELESAESYDPESTSSKKYRKELKLVESRRFNAWNQWFQLWKNIRGFQETRLNREAPKKLEVTHRNEVSVDEFNRLMRRVDKGEIVDAEYDIIEDKEAK